jgi:protoporphyrinogen oxidase
MKYLIIGGGISGLYTAYVLRKKQPLDQICVVEKVDRLGGRICTEKVKDVFLEMGAGGVVSTQNNILKLINELGLSEKLSEGSSGRSLVHLQTIPTDLKSVPSVYQITKIENIFDTKFYQLVDDLYKKLTDPIFYHYANSTTLYSLVEKLYGVETANWLMYQFGYRADINEQNAIKALEMFQTAFSPKAEFHSIKGGMSQIIEKLEEYLVQNNVQIIKNCECLKIEKEQENYKVTFDKNPSLSAQNIILAIPQKNVKKINILNLNLDKKLNCVFSHDRWKNLV